MEDTLRCYRTLDLEPGASAAQVRRAYVDLAQVWDPERYLSNPTLWARAQVKREEITLAYKTLRTFLPDLPEENTGDVPLVAPPLLPGASLVDSSSQPIRTIILWLLLLTLVGIGVAGYILSKRAKLFTV